MKLSYDEQQALLDFLSDATPKECHAIVQDLLEVEEIAPEIIANLPNLTTEI